MGLSKYEADNATIHQIRLKASRVTAAGGAPDGDVDSDIKVKVSKGNKEFGIRPRRVRLRREVTVGTVTAVRYSSLPILKIEAWNGENYTLNKTVTIDGIAWTIYGRDPEDY